MNTKISIIKKAPISVRINEVLRFRLAIGVVNFANGLKFSASRILFFLRIATDDYRLLFKDE